MAEEPFATEYSEWHPGEKNYIDLIKDTCSLEEVLGDIFSRFNGIKILSYQLPEDIYSHMLLLPQFKVIFLQRRNALQAIVSGLIAEQTSVWHISDLNDEREQLYHRLKPLAVEEIQARLTYLSYLRTFYERVLLDKPPDDYLPLFYEDFYCGDLEGIRAKLKEVFEFIGVSMPETPDFDYFLDKQTAKINPKERYKMIPNAEEINFRFGSDETGWL